LEFGLGEMRCNSVDQTMTLELELGLGSMPCKSVDQTMTLELRLSFGAMQFSRLGIGQPPEGDVMTILG